MEWSSLGRWHHNRVISVSCRSVAACCSLGACSGTGGERTVDNYACSRGAFTAWARRARPAVDCGLRCCFGPHRARHDRIFDYVMAERLAQALDAAWHRCCVGRLRSRGNARAKRGAADRGCYVCVEVRRRSVRVAANAICCHRRTSRDSTFVWTVDAYTIMTCDLECDPFGYRYTSLGPKRCLFDRLAIGD